MKDKSEDPLSIAGHTKARVLLDVFRSHRIEITKAVTGEEQEQERKTFEVSPGGSRKIISLRAGVSAPSDE